MFDGLATGQGGQELNIYNFYGAFYGDVVGVGDFDEDFISES